jgi:hypothetical protein
VLFPRDKSAVCAQVLNEKELYLLSTQAPPWHVAGLLYFFYLTFIVYYIILAKIVIIY